MFRVVVVVVLLALGAARADAKSEATAILERAIASEKDPKVLSQALIDLDRLIEKNPKDSDAHYARGFVLSRTGKNNDEAVAAYDRAFELDKRLADAAYNAGVVLGRIGNNKEAAVRFDRALKVAPKMTDAAYNAGQSYYDLGDYATAAARWEVAAKLSPDDFQIAKKLVQAYVALGKVDKVKPARARVIAMWKSGKDPEVGKLKSYLYDQFVVGKYHVFVYEAFETSAAVTYVYQAKVALKDKIVGSLLLETSPKGFVLALDKDEKTTLPDNAWTKQPDYQTFKAHAIKTIDAKF
jgi:tetratricopeptide (TPR) repeat protein